MKLAYFDCFAGASGDMILGALLDAGLDLERLRTDLGKLGLGHFRVDAQRVLKRGMAGTRALVEVDEHYHGHRHRRLRDIEALIEGSALDSGVKERSVAVFRRLAQAEAKVHRTTVDDIHFHEVGAMDAIIDVVGSVAGLSALGIERIHCSPLHVGSGMVQCAHGVLPVPAPATAELITGKPAYSTGVEGELLTPTGAALLTTLAAELGPMPAMTVRRVGYGAGALEPRIPNLLRIILGEAERGSPDHLMERVGVLETNIDDMNPQLYDHVIQKALAEGALDVFLTPVHMKKNRPAALLSLICPPERLHDFADLILRETTSLGLRWRVDNRIKLRRAVRGMETPYGLVRFKIAGTGKEVVNAAPEYEDCRRLALEKGVPLKKVFEAAQRVALKLEEEGSESWDD